MIAEVSVDGPARVASGDEATFEVMIDFGGDAYAISDIDEVKYLVFDALGELALTGTASSPAPINWRLPSRPCASASPPSRPSSS